MQATQPELEKQKILIIKKQKGEDLFKIKALKQQIKELREENTRLQQKEMGT